jgi:hypothetical protein
LKRVSKKPPTHLSPADCLRFCGLEKNEATRALFYLAENYERILEGRIIKSTLGKKWVDSVYACGGVRKVAGEELNEGNRDGELEGASLFDTFQSKRKLSMGSGTGTGTRATATARKSS